MKLKGIDHVSLAVVELDLSVDFYRRAFGYELAFAERGMAREIRSMMGMERLSCHLAQLSGPWGGPRLELIQFLEAGTPAQARPLSAGSGHIGMTVENADEALREAVALGAVPLGSVTVFPEGRSVYCREPGGSFFELLEFNGEPPP
jgi:catechol 2,3-dioxygenase-like lactoylglutathione lyase family enzyme